MPTRIPWSHRPKAFSRRSSRSRFSPGSASPSPSCSSAVRAMSRRSSSSRRPSPPATEATDHSTVRAPMDFDARSDHSDMSTSGTLPRPVVHLELHTPDQMRASAFYVRLLQWRPEVIRSEHGSYVALETGAPLGGGIVECGARRPVWLPYVEVVRIDESTERARQLGADVLLEPRECLSGWRSVVSTPEAGELALWEPRR